MYLLKKYNEEIALILFCIGMLCYALGLSSFSKLGGTQSFFHIGAFLFIICNYKRFSKRALYILIIPIATFLIVCILGMLTYFDEVLARPFSVVVSSVNQHIIGFFALFILLFFYGLYAKQKNVKFFLFFFILLCAFEVATMFYLGFMRGGFRHHITPFWFKAVFTYNIWLLAPAAMCLAAMIFLHRKLFALLGLIFVLLAILANGERSFLVAFVCMIFIAALSVPYIVHYKYKTPLFVGIVCMAILFVAGFYRISSSFSDRYNFAHMVDNFIHVWETPPIEMGQYDVGCFAKRAWIVCAPESIALGKSEITWEHSSLSRINMGKSTLLAFLDEPFKPHVVGVFQIGEYLWQYYNLKNHENRSYIVGSIDGDLTNLNGYNQPHNFVVSILFCYGLIGFICIVVFQGFLLYSGWRGIQKDDRLMQFFGGVLLLLVCGICIQGLFDVFYHSILQTLFVFYGIVTGLMWRNKNEDSSNN